MLQDLCFRLIHSVVEILHIRIIVYNTVRCFSVSLHQFDMLRQNTYGYYLFFIIMRT